MIPDDEARVQGDIGSKQLLLTRASE